MYLMIVYPFIRYEERILWTWFCLLVGLFYGPGNAYDASGVTPSGKLDLLRLETINDNFAGKIQMTWLIFIKYWRCWYWIIIRYVCDTYLKQCNIWFVIENGFCIWSHMCVTNFEFSRYRTKAVVNHSRKDCLLIIIYMDLLFQMLWSG